MKFSITTYLIAALMGLVAILGAAKIVDGLRIGGLNKKISLQEAQIVQLNDQLDAAESTRENDLAAYEKLQETGYQTTQDAVNAALKAKPTCAKGTQAQYSTKGVLGK